MLIHVHPKIHRHVLRENLLMCLCMCVNTVNWAYINVHACERLHLRHSGIMHFSTSTTSAPQIEPSDGGIFTIRSRLFMPSPQVALHASHSPHSVTRQLLGATPAETYTVHMIRAENPVWEMSVYYIRYRKIIWTFLIRTDANKKTCD